MITLFLSMIFLSFLLAIYNANSIESEYDYFSHKKIQPKSTINL